MNAHAHKGFEADSREPEGYIDGCYEITLGKTLGEFCAGNVLVFDMEKEPQPGEMVALRRPGLPGVQVGKLVTDLPTARWADMPFADSELREGGFVFAFQALGDDVPRIIDMAVLDGIDGCVEVVHRPGADNENALGTKRTKPTPPRDAKGRFLKSDTLSGRFKLEIVESFYEDGELRCLAQSIGEPPRAHIPFWLGFSLEGEGAEAGQRDFAGLRRAIGVLGPTDTSEIHFKPFVADVNFVDGDYRLSNFEGADAKPDADDENEERRERGLRDRLNMEGPAFELEFLWALLEPYIEDQLGDRKGPYDFVLDGKELPVRAESLRVIGAKEAEVMHFHLVRLGMQIDALTKANTGRA